MYSVVISDNETLLRFVIDVFRPDSSNRFYQFLLPNIDEVNFLAFILDRASHAKNKSLRV